MYLLITVINNEELIDELLTGWIDIGVSGTTVLDSIDSLEIISHHVPLFAGFRILSGGGMSRNKTLFTIIENEKTLELAVGYLEKICEETAKAGQGIYYVTPLIRFGKLGIHRAEGDD